jgi:multiple sugar transport system ATP-binding protein
MPGELSGGTVKLPIGEVDVGEAARGRSDGSVVAGLRPESFEDAALVGEEAKRDGGLLFEAEVELVESLGSDLYAYFQIESEGVESDQLADLVGDSLDETGAANLREGKEQVIARLDASSRIRRGERTELWVDTSRLHLFDPESGASLRRGES